MPTAEAHQGNRVFNNLTVGIDFANGTIVTGNVIYSNGTWGIQGGNNGGATTISNNLIYANVSGGFDTTVGNLITLLNNTIYQPTGVGITVTNNGVASTATPFTFRNNIIEVGAGPAYSIDDFSFPGFLADYNDIFVTGTGSIASVAGHTINSGAIWAVESANDTHSIFVDPKFVNPAGADGVIGYSGGVDHGGDDNFNVQSTSPTIDAADPSLPVSMSLCPTAAVPIWVTPVEPRRRRQAPPNNSSAFARPIELACSRARPFRLPGTPPGLAIRMHTPRQSFQKTR